MARKASGSYLEKLKDPRWQKKRLEILARDEFACQACFDTETTLHVHHRYYTKGADPWDYPPDALLTLCEECHALEGDLRPGIEAALLMALRKQFLCNDLAVIAGAFMDMKMVHVPEVVASTIARIVADPDRLRTVVHEMLEPGE